VHELTINFVVHEYANLVNQAIKTCRENLSLEDIKIKIVVWDSSKQPLKISGFDEIHWNRFNPSLSRVWNWAIAQSETEWTMVCNEDLKFKSGWLSLLMVEMKNNQNAMWFGPSRCFVFNKSLIESVGWFDERFTGITYEDLDYIRRMNHAGVKSVYGRNSVLWDCVNDLKSNISRKLVPCNNFEFFKTKYNNHNTEDFFDTPLFETPDFYPLRKLNT
jgi:hypothetical protein